MLSCQSEAFRFIKEASHVTAPHALFANAAVLLGWCCRLLQEQQAWMQLLSQYNAMAGTSSAAADAEGQTAPGTASLSPSPPQQSPSTVPTPGPAAAGTPAVGSTPGATAAAAAGTPLAAAGTDGEREQDADAAMPAGLDADAGVGGGAEGPVCAEQQESLLGVQLKVEVLTALVTKMEHLVARAEATARALQVSARCSVLGCCFCNLSVVSFDSCKVCLQGFEKRCSV
jgi:hypothetical protein